MKPTNPSSSKVQTRLAVLALALAGACVAPPHAEDYLAVGFRSPEQTFHSFQTAMAGDQIDLEYRCLGRDFRLEHSIDGMTYRLAREQLFAENPFIKLVTQGEITASERLAPDRHRLVVRVKNWFADRSFQVFLVREDFFEAFDEERSLFFDFDSFEEHVFTDEDSPSLLYAVAKAPLDLDPKQLTELCFGREWRLAGFEPLAESEEPKALSP